MYRLKNERLILDLQCLEYCKPIKWTRDIRAYICIFNNFKRMFILFYTSGYTSWLCVSLFSIFVRNFFSQIHNVNNLMPAISNDSSNKYIHALCIFLALWYIHYFLYIKLMILNYAWSFNPLPFHSPVNFVPYNCIKTMLQFVPSYMYIYIYLSLCQHGYPWFFFLI